MKNFAVPFWIALLILVPACMQSQEATLEQPKVIGLLGYADWCEFCKVLEPKLKEIQPEFKDQPILFTRMDFTDDFSTAQSARYAAILGLEQLYAENAGKTGYMALIAWPSRELIGLITADRTPEEIRSMLTAALQR